ncbi:MAG: hypothetical protein GY702_25025 [Desulfobulbaceae bacterium]|nr:hypothetical protein [Desulfobulbaceae bacterium]
MKILKPALHIPASHRRLVHNGSSVGVEQRLHPTYFCLVNEENREYHFRATASDG